MWQGESQAGKRDDPEARGNSSWLSVKTRGKNSEHTLQSGRERWKIGRSASTAAGAVWINIDEELGFNAAGLLS